MTNETELRDRMIEVFRRGGDGYGGVEGGMQAVIDEFGLRYERRVIEEFSPSGFSDERRLVGKWRKK